jgi:hypothetical protein
VHQLLALLKRFFFCNGQNFARWTGLMGLQPCEVGVIQSVPFKTQPNSSHVLQHGKRNQKQVHAHEVGCPSIPLDTRVKFILVARRLLAPVVRKLCRCERRNVNSTLLPNFDSGCSMAHSLSAVLRITCTVAKAFLNNASRPCRLFLLNAFHGCKSKVCSSDGRRQVRFNSAPKLGGV